MKMLVISSTMFFLVLVPALGPGKAPAHDPATSRNELSATLRAAIERHLGYPYGRGHSGPKRFDCSGFVWRVMVESGIRIKRTSARKLYVMLPEVGAEERWRFGNVVFFNGLRHCGLVKDASSFYHASSSRGTTRTAFAPYWRGRISGIRGLPL